MNRSVTNNPRAYFLASLIPLLISDLVKVLITYHYSVDRAWWAVLLVLLACVSFLYSVLAYLPARLTGQFDRALALRHQSLLGAVQIMYTFAFFLARPDWLAVNDRRVRLTPFQSVVYNHWTPWIIYLFFYILLIVRFGLSHRNRAKAS